MKDIVDSKGELEKKKEVIEVLSANKPMLESMGIKSLALFGSVVRDEAYETSDVDLLIEFSRPVGLIHFSRVRLYLSDLLGCNVDLVTRDAIRAEMRDVILTEAVRAA